MRRTPVVEKPSARRARRSAAAAAPQSAPAAAGTDSGAGAGAGMVLSPLARMVFDRARQRSGQQVDTLQFAARCPGCDQDRQWTQIRDDTRTVTSIDCDC